jgi:hypothetical protein
MGGSSFTSVNVSSNGLLDFDDANTRYTPASFPTNDATDDYVLAPFWDDLIVSNSALGGVYYKAGGLAPWRFMMITWYDWAHQGVTTERLRFQVILHETTNEVEYRYSNLGARLTPDTTGYNLGNGMEGEKVAEGSVVTSGTQIRLSPNPDSSCRYFSQNCGN